VTADLQQRRWDLSLKTDRGEESRVRRRKEERGGERRREEERSKERGGGWGRGRTGK